MCLGTTSAKNGCKLQLSLRRMYRRHTLNHHRWLLFLGAMRARGRPRMATSPPMKDAAAATKKDGAFPPPNSASHGPLPSDTMICSRSQIQVSGLRGSSWIFRTNLIRHIINNFGDLSRLPELQAQNVVSHDIGDHVLTILGWLVSILHGFQLIFRAKKFEDLAS